MGKGSSTIEKEHEQLDDDQVEKIKSQLNMQEIADVQQMNKAQLICLLGEQLETNKSENEKLRKQVEEDTKQK